MRHILLGGGIMAALLLGACLPDVQKPAPTADSGFTWRGKPIDPLCLQMDMDSASQPPVDLAACTGSAGKTPDTTPDAKGLQTFEDGSVGYEFACGDGCMRAPMIAYKYLGRVGDLYAVQVNSSGGGSGFFTTLAFYAIHGDTLTMARAINGGDRCNGGLADAAVKDGALTYAVNITPYDLVEMSGGNTSKFAAYDDIQACAACCVGTADYTGDALTSVTLSEPPNPDNASAPHDACFFEVYARAYKNGDVMSPDGLKAFGADFAKSCKK